MKPSRIVWWLGIASIIASGALNVLFLIETTHMVTIQVPTHTLSPYQVITSSDVTTTKMPLKSLNGDILAGNLIGKVTSMAIPQGEPVQRFEIAQQGSIAQVIQNLYQTYPNDAFAQIQVQNTTLSQTVQPNQHVNLFANNMIYPDVWVLSETNPSDPNHVSNITQAVNQFVNVNPTSTSNSGTLTFIVGGPWSVVQSLMDSSNTQVVIGNATSPGQPDSFGSPPLNQSQSNSKVAPNQENPKKVGADHVK